jgi:predicted N-acetyltransferase YhbS
MPEFVIVDARPEDARDIIAVQKAAFAFQAALYGDWEIPPMTETAEGLVASMGEGTTLKAVVDGLMVGSVRGRESEGTCRVGRLSVHPSFQKRGIGAALMIAVEARFPRAARFELFTGCKSDGNIRLYERIGYASTSARKRSCTWRSPALRPPADFRHAARQRIAGVPGAGCEGAPGRVPLSARSSTYTTA